jgi:osmotically-inducible protein OsmY
MGKYYEEIEPPFFLWYEPKTDLLQKNKLAYERPDEDIVDDLEARFGSLPGVDASRVIVACRRNQVVLSGICANERTKAYLGRVAANVLGVRSVDNLITVDKLRAGATSEESSLTK